MEIVSCYINISAYKYGMRYIEMNIFFWNIMKRVSNIEICAEMASHSNAEIVCLCEAENIGDHLIHYMMNVNSIGSYHYKIVHRNEGIVLITKGNIKSSNCCVSRRHSVINISPVIYGDFTMVLLHLPSRLYYDAESLTSYCKYISDELRLRHEIHNKDRVILIGDFNLNPFDHAVVDVTKFNACLYSDVINAKNSSRSFIGNKTRFLYNPMMRVFKNSTVHGTYFYDGSDSVNYYWNIFDQFLVSSDLIDKIDFVTTKIVDSHPSGTLLDHRQRPDSKNKSDHLPLLICIDMS